MKRLSGLVLAVCAAGVAAQGAGLLLEIDAQSAAGLVSGQRVSSLAAGGSANCTFSAVVPGQGMTYSANFNATGAKGFVFDGSLDSVMAGGATPSSICGDHPWSWEIWVYNPSLDGNIESVFGWTVRENWIDGNAGNSCMEFRYGTDVNNAVEHYGGNVTWGGLPPDAGQWHHVACTFDESGIERLYVDGSLRVQMSNWLRLRDDGFFWMGGVPAGANWDWRFSGAIGKLCVYEGVIPAGQILADYAAERAVYGQFAAPDISVWTGAAGSPLDWGDPLNWLMGAVGGGNHVVIENGGVAALDAAVGPLLTLSALDGGLALDSGAELVLLSDTNLGVGPGNAFGLTILGGSLVASNRVYFGFAGADASVTVGGGPDAASLWIRDASFGRGHDTGAGGNGTASVTVASNGTVTVREGWLCLGRYAGGASSLTVEEGGRFEYLGNEGIVVGGVGADGVLTMNGGVLDIRPWGRVMMSEADGTAQAFLNGGEISVQQFYDNNAASSEIYFNGTLIRAPVSDGMWTDYFQGVKGLYLMPGGAVLEVTNNWTMNVRSSFTDAPLSGGGITKLGDGSLRLYGTNDFTGPIAVEGGGVFLQGEDPLPLAYAGGVSVANGGIVALQCAGGAGLLAAQMDALSVGRIGLYAVNAQDTIDLSLLPDVALEPLENFAFEGTLIPYDNHFMPALSNDFTFAGTLVDLPGAPGRITLGAGTPPGRALTLASSNDISGLVLVEGGLLVVEDAHALGTGPITLRNGAALCLNSDTITTPVAAGIVSRITPDSSGCILLDLPCAGVDLDLGGLPGVYVGARPSTMEYTGTITPDGVTYRLGGGRQSEFGGERGLELTVRLTDGLAARGVEVGMPGMVYLMAGNSYSGKTTLTGGGIAYVLEDSALGTPPASLAADHLTLDGGVLRVGGGANVQLDANRGVTVTANGGAFHNWGGTSLNIHGPLAGPGTLRLTDSGVTRLFSPNNTFTGGVYFQTDINGISYLDIGDGPNFSWVSTEPIWGIVNGGWVSLNTDNAAIFAPPLLGAVGLTKKGAGTVTLIAADNTYAFGTRVEGGGLKLAAPGVIPHGEGRGDLHLFAGTRVDVNGFAVTLNGLNGPGAVTNAAGAAAVLTVGDGGASSVFAGALADQMAYRKVGAGVHADFGTSPVLSPEVEEGTFMLADLRRLQGAPLLTGGGATLSLKTFNGLPGKFADVPPTANEWFDENRWILDEPWALNDFFDNVQEDILTHSAELGLYFDYGNNGQFFPGKYSDGGVNNFIAAWRGTFYAPVAGNYLFATASDDASVLYINGQKVVDNIALQGWGDGNGYPNRKGGTLWLPRGPHDILIGFMEQGGGQGLTVWGGIGGNMPWDAVGILPQMFLDSDAPLTPDGILANTLSAAVTGGPGTWVEKVGLPPLIVAADNSGTFGGTWAVRSGEARVVDGGDFGGDGAIVDAGATLAFDYTGDAIYGGDVRGGGALRHAGPATLTLTGHNTYKGGTVIDQGTLRVEAPGTLGGGGLVVNGTLELAFSGTVRQSDVMPVTTATGSGEIVLVSGTLIADTFTSVTVPVRVLDGASYVVATPGAAEVTLEGSTGELGNSDVRITDLLDESLWKTNGWAEWISPGVARVTQTVPGSGTGTLILKEQINAALPWEASFTYTMAGTTTGNPADGFSMFIHNDPARGASAVGGGATDSGVAGIPTAFGFILQIYPNVDPFFRFCWVQDGIILNETKVEDLNGVEPRWGDTQVRVVHDGTGMITVTLTQDGNVYTDSRVFDIVAELNGMMGWFGFGGAVGGCNADQQVSNLHLFTPRRLDAPFADDGSWVFNGSARPMPDDTIQITPLTGGTGTMYLKEKVDLLRMWRLSFRYYIENRQNDSADGFAVFVHNDPRGDTAVGGGGGNRGYTGITPQSGFSINIFGENYLVWITDGAPDGGNIANPNGIIPVNGDMDVTMEYDGAGLLCVKLEQGGNRWTGTRAIDLSAALGSPDAWLGISGATGGVTADQRVAGLTFAYWLPGYLCPSYGASFSVMPGNANSTLYGSFLPPEANADTLTLNSGAALDIRPNPLLGPDAAYAVAFQNIVLNGASSVAVHGDGLLTIAHLYVNAAGDTVTFNGNIAFPGGVLTVHAPVDLPRGFYAIADFTSASGVFGPASFALDPVDTPPRAQLIWRGNKLYLSLVQGTVMILR